MQVYHHERMRRLVCAGLAALGLCATATVLDAQSLTDVARQEAARRKAITKPAKLYTNGSLRPAPSVSAPTAPASALPEIQPPPGNPGPDQPVINPAPPAGAPPAAAAAPQDEASWRRRVTELRDRRDRNTVFLESLQTRINSLWADFTSRDDPSQRAVIAQDRARALSELDRLTAEQLALTKQIADVEEQARRAGVPPGWLR